MFDHFPTEDGSKLPAAAQPSSLPTEEQEIQAVNAREELLLRARSITRRVQEQVWRMMGGEDLNGPHQRAPEPEAGPEPIQKQPSPKAPPPSQP